MALIPALSQALYKRSIRPVLVYYVPSDGVGRAPRRTKSWRMLPCLPLLLLVTLAASNVMKSPEDLEREMFPPVNPNCTQSLTDYILLRQEIQLSKMAAAEEARTQLMRENLQVLTQVRDTLSQVSETLTQRSQVNGKSLVETRKYLLFLCVY
ncbi:uncharacterized protein LOC119569584 [Penaeus monodon]|uniref:uncharacterized protein LOC119569584 n=1 Tax=Penaeus monodon TaxID=6687 RepID=UPI0018A7AE66|nr:uncharacterized protein LOC119569584 [Penaeus monodon]